MKNRSFEFVLALIVTVIAPLVVFIVLFLWDSMTISLLDRLNSDTYEIESTDRLANGVKKRLLFLGQDPIVQERGSGKRKTFLAVPEHGCSKIGESFPEKALQPRAAPGSFFTIRFRRDLNTLNINFKFTGGRVLYIGLTKPYPRQVCFGEEQTMFNISYNPGSNLDTQQDRSVIVMLSGLDADVSASNITNRSVKIAKIFILALLTLGGFILYNAFSLISNTWADKDYRRSANDVMETLGKGVHKLEDGVTGISKDLRQMSGYRPSALDESNLTDEKVNARHALFKKYAEEATETAQLATKNIAKPKKPDIDQLKKDMF